MFMKLFNALTDQIAGRLIWVVTGLVIAVVGLINPAWAENGIIGAARSLLKK